VIKNRLLNIGCSTDMDIGLNLTKMGYTVEIGKYQKYGELLKNSVDNYPLREKIVFVMKDMACVEQALAMGAVVSASLKNSHLFEKH
jgi:hypothetical protein